MRQWLALLFVCTSLFAEDRVAHFEGAPSGIAAGWINVVSGALQLGLNRVASQSISRLPIQEVIAQRENILFGQHSVSTQFSNAGTFSGKSIGEVAKGWKNGTISPQQLPIEIIVRNGQNVTLNNRSLLALRRAWMEPQVVLDRAGIKMYEDLLIEHLRGGQPGFAPMKADHLGSLFYRGNSS